MTEVYFRLKKLFIPDPHVQLSVRDVAEAYDLSIPESRCYILEDLDNGLILGDAPALLRRQSYYLLQRGLDLLYEELIGHLK